MYSIKYATACGSFAIIASLCSGCATQPPMHRIPMATQDLDRFQIDCARREQQIAFLESQRVTREDRFESRMRLLLKPWEYWTAPTVHAVNAEIAHNNPNRYIDLLLHEIRQC